MRNILIIDDESDIRQIAALALEATAGWKITTAASATEGIRLACSANPKPDAILMDVTMPGMDGPAAYCHMQQTPGVAGIPVLFLTARVSKNDQRRFSALGVLATLSKPFDPLTLADQVSEVLGWSRTPAPVPTLRFTREFPHGIGIR